MDTKIKVKIPNGDIKTITLSKTDFIWDVIEADEREMGMERLHEACCDYCDIYEEPISVTLRVWEYPEGFLNDSEIELEGAELVGEYHLDNLIDLI